MFRLDGKVAMVTGAAGGLGAGIAVALARQGADLALVGRPGGTPLDDTAHRAEGYGRRVCRVEMDLRDLSQIEAGVMRGQEEFGAIDILVNNAGVNRPAPALTVTADKWGEQFEANVRGGFFLAQAVAPAMIERGWGRVIWVSSQAGVVGIPGQPVYCATKGAVNQLVRTLGLEWARHGITVNAIGPTFVETALTRNRLQQPEFRSYVLNKIPAGRLARVEEVAAAAVFLASEEASMVNCHVLLVDGGWTAW
ncbi:MAG: SDR family oxidoreductase [Chloroflexi bacterium]|nr:SDR family oxidoreductase [Chloroflexota bacterium]